MGVMTAPDFWSGQDRMLTVEDMEDMPDDEFRYELDDGVLIVSPAPSRFHQLAVTRLAVILSAACPVEFVVLAGVGVNVTKFQHRVPDVAVVRADSFETFFQETPPANASEMSGFRWGWGRCVVVTVGERPGSPVCVVLRGLEGTAIGAGAVHEARLGGTFPLTAACLTVLM